MCQSYIEVLPYSLIYIYIWTPRSITLPRSRCACGVTTTAIYKPQPYLLLFQPRGAQFRNFQVAGQEVVFIHNDRYNVNIDHTLTIHLPSQELSKILIVLSNYDHAWNYCKHMGKGTSTESELSYLQL